MITAGSEIGPFSFEDRFSGSRIMIGIRHWLISVVLPARAGPVTAILPGYETLFPSPDKIFPAGHFEPFEHKAPVLRFPGTA